MNDSENNQLEVQIKTCKELLQESNQALAEGG